MAQQFGSGAEGRAIGGQQYLPVHVPPLNRYALVLEQGAYQPPVLNLPARGRAAPCPYSAGRVHAKGLRTLLTWAECLVLGW
jgi:hypothetical protein